MSALSLALKTPLPSFSDFPGGELARAVEDHHMHAVAPVQFYPFGVFT